MDYFQKLHDFIKENGVQCEHLKFTQSCHSVTQAAAAAGADPGDFVKSICLRSKDGLLIVAVVKGGDKASRDNIALALGIPKPDIAQPEFMLQASGYPAGGTPPFGYAANFLIDERVMEKGEVYAGGGSADALVKISPKEMLRVNKGVVARIREVIA